MCYRQFYMLLVDGLNLAIILNLACQLNRCNDGKGPRQQTFMQVIATLEEADGEFAIQDITTASRKLLKKPFNPSHATQMLGHLAEKGLIYRNRRGSYCFAVPLLASFIRRQTWDAATRRDRPTV